MQLLIVEDDRLIAENLYDFLEACGHRCDYARTLAEARQRCADEHFSALILDRNLPDGDGVTLVRELRAAGNFVPILLLTARDALDEKLEGFAAGADDYLAKPFALKEVEARLRVLERRGVSRPPACLVCAGLQLDTLARTAQLDGVELNLSPKALRLLEVLLQQPGRVFSRAELELAIWGHEQAASDNLRSVLLGLRKALAPSPALQIVNVHGLGYKFVSR